MIETSKNKKRFLVFSDSLSCMHALSNGDTSKPLLTHVLEELTSLVMCWMCLPIDSSYHDRLCRIRLYTKPFFRCQKHERSFRFSYAFNNSTVS